MKILDVSATVIIGVIAVAFLMMSGDLGRTAALFPKILSMTIIGLVMIYVGMQIYAHRKNRPLKSPEIEAKVKKVPGVNVLTTNRWYIIIGFIGFYMGLMYMVGFALASFVFGVALPYCGGYRKMKVIVPVSLGMTVGLVVIGKLFHIPLPTGLWLSML